MLVEIIIYIIGVVANFFASFMPGNGDIPLKLPWGIDDILVQGVAGYKVLSTAYPPLEVVLQAFLLYIGFRIVLQLLKAVPILGRTIR